jgi:hypothetical protein
MSDLKISELPAADAVGGNELIPLVQTGETRRVLVSDLLPSQATDAEVQAGVDNKKYLTSSVLSSWWNWIKGQAQSFAGNVTLNGVNNTAPNQVGVEPGASTLLTLAQSKQQLLFNELGISRFTPSLRSARVTSGVSCTNNYARMGEFLIDGNAAQDSYGSLSFTSDRGDWMGNIFSPLFTDGVLQINFNGSQFGGGCWMHSIGTWLPAIQADYFDWNDPYFINKTISSADSNYRGGFLILIKYDPQSNITKCKLVVCHSGQIFGVTQSDWVDWHYMSYPTDYQARLYLQTEQLTDTKHFKLFKTTTGVDIPHQLSDFSLMTTLSVPWNNNVCPFADVTLTSRKITTGEDAPRILLNTLFWAYGQKIG